MLIESFIRLFFNSNKKIQFKLIHLLYIHSSKNKYSNLIGKREFDYIINFSLGQLEGSFSFFELLKSNLKFPILKRSLFIQEVSDKLLLYINDNYKVNKFIMNGYCYWNIELKNRKLYRNFALNKNIILGASCEGHINNYNKNTKMLPQYIGVWINKNYKIKTENNIKKFLNYEESEYQYFVIFNTNPSINLDLKLFPGNLF